MTLRLRPCPACGHIVHHIIIDAHHIVHGAHDRRDGHCCDCPQHRPHRCEQSGRSYDPAAVGVLFGGNG